MSINIDRFVRNGQVVDNDLQGHKTLYPDKGKNGTLKCTVLVKDETERWRKGNNIHTNHYVSLSDALCGCVLTIPTVQGTQEIKLAQGAKSNIFKLEGKGAKTVAI